jgi:response regulator RpfG family c-di-GMP phosphodiesterase
MQGMQDIARGVEEFAVLYVDDEVHNLSAFRAEFRREAIVMTAGSLDEALMVLEDNPIDLLVTDHMMPNGTGLELLQRLSKLYPDLKRVLITAYGEKDLVKDAINMGEINWYVEKPWSQQDMHGIFRETKSRMLNREHRRNRINELKRKMDLTKKNAHALRSHLKSRGDKPSLALIDELLSSLEGPA